VNRRTTQAVLAGVIAILLVAAGVTAAGADRRGGDDEFEARLSGYEETPETISTGASGRFSADVDRRDEEIDYRLSYSGLEGNVLFAHIHFGRKATGGGVSAFLCGGGGKPACPQEGTVEGTIVPADVVGPADQGIAPGEFEELVRAMQVEATYANVHSSMWPSGEIRGQIREDD
jgi:CHRD domain-containing protein